MPVARWSMAYALEAAVGMRGRRRLAGRLRIEGLEVLEGGRTGGGVVDDDPTRRWSRTGTGGLEV